MVFSKMSENYLCGNEDHLAFLKISSQDTATAEL